MSELDFLKTASEFVTDVPYGGEPHPGWNVENILCQQISMVKAIGEESSEVFILGWLEKKSPFTQEDLLDNEEDQVQDLIFRIRSSPCISYRESLANRLVTLLNDAREEEDFAGAGIPVGSLRNFYNFLQLHTNVKCPAVSLTPDYDIYASWKVEQNRLFSVHFLSNGDTRFVIFKPNDLHPERQIRISGTVTTDILMATVAPYGVWDWISE